MDPLAPVVNLEERGLAFRDLTLLFEVLGAYGEAARDLAELHLARDQAGDRDAGVAVAARIQRLLFVQGGLLETHLPSAPPTELTNAVARWKGAISDRPIHGVKYTAVPHWD